MTIGVTCTRCSHSQQITLSGLYKDDNHTKYRCQKCAVIAEVTLNPCFLHERSLTLGYLDVSTCTINDVTRFSLRATCMDCQDAYILHDLARGVRGEASCPECMHKLAFQAKSLAIEDVDGAPLASQSKKATSGKAKSKAPQQRITEGQPLPNQGACEHFKKSLRWLRFTCCGRAFPCPICHEKSDCEAADMGVIAARMICGKCSAEQNFANSPCRACGFAMGKGRAAQFWEGGGGARSSTALSKKDSRKNQGVSRSGAKKTASKKSQRVGAAGKKNRSKKQAS